MEVKAVTLDQVFMKNRTLRIPFFQRGYVWQKSNWKKFFDDIVEIARELQEGYMPKDYFIGSIILKKKKDRGPQIAEVIDGQQRLTTIVLFTKALCLAIGRNDLFKDMFYLNQTSLDSPRNPILVPNYNDKLVYEKIINLEFLESEEVAENNRLADAFSYFANCILDAKRGGEGYDPLSLDKLYEAFTYYIRVVVIEVSADEDAQKIFETINCTGIKLTTGELLKNYLFDEDKVEEYNRCWKPVFENNCRSYWEGDMVNGRLQGSHIENFFYRYMLIKMQEPGIKSELRPNETKQYRQKDGLYEKFCNLMTRFNISKEEAIEEIVGYAQLYMDTFKSDTLDTTAVAYAGIERLAYLMFLQDAWTMTPYILYILHHVESESERNRIFHYMEIYLMRRIICKSKNNNYSDMFSENLIGQQVDTFEGFRAYVNDVDNRGSLLMPSDEEVRNAVCQNDLKKDADTIFYMLESRLNHDFTNSSRNNSSTALFKEQVMPEKENKNWTFDVNFSEEEHLQLTRTLGNMTLVREKLKAKVKNATWTEKRMALKELVPGLNTCQFYKIQQWTEKEIIARNNWLSDQILEAWPM